MIPVGFTLQPDEQFLALMDEVIANHADYVEIAPETTWRTSGDDVLVPNGFHRRFAAILASTGQFAVAHGVGMSLGSAHPGDAARRAMWLERMRADQEVFGYRWYSEHLGASSLAGQCAMLPMPVPMTATSVAMHQARLVAMQAVVPEVGVENSVFYFLWGEPLAEAGFLAEVVARPGCHLVLDLHNLYTQAVNHGVELAAYLGRLPLDKVIEIHISGGSESEPAWLPDGGTMRLDSHDHAVPEPVWQLLEDVAPRCPGLRGITLERMEGTVTPADVPRLAEELTRIRDIARTCP